MTELFGERLREASVDIRDLPRDELGAALPGIRQSVTPAQVAELVRLACHKSRKTDFESDLRRSLKSAVETFPLRGEEQYVAIVALELLVEMQETNGDKQGPTAALLSRAARFSGWTPVHPDLYTIADAAVRRGPAANVADAPKVRVPSRSSAAKDALEAVKAEASYQNLLDALIEVAQELSRVRSALGQLQDNIVSRFVGPLEEQATIMWWLLSGWSHLRGVALAELGPLSLAYQVGLDLASLTRVPPGPAVADALINQALRNAGADPTQLVDAKVLAEADIDAARTIPDLPEPIDDLLPALALNGQLPRGSSWTELSREVYDEALLLRVFDHSLEVRSA